MIAFTNVIELNKVLRNCLITQSQMNEKMVLNSLSLYGTELDKLLISLSRDQRYTSIEQNDALLLFELISRESSGDISITENEENPYHNITYNKAFKLKIIIYGDAGSDIALKTIARLRTEEVRNNLYEQGVYLEKVSDPFILNEYKNETMWLRNDFEMDIAVQFKIVPILTDHEFTNISELNLIKNEEETNV